MKITIQDLETLSPEEIRTLIEDILGYDIEKNEDILKNPKEKIKTIPYFQMGYSPSDREFFRESVLSFMYNNFFKFQEIILFNDLKNKVTNKITPHGEIHEIIINNIFRKEYSDNKLNSDDSLSLVGEATTTKTVVIVPRGHGKTTTIKHSFVFDIAFKLEVSILYIASSGLGLDMLGKVRDEFENNKLLVYLFGRLVPSRAKNELSKKWRSTELNFLNGVQLQTVGKKGSVRGKRPTKLVVDDPQENEEVLDKKNTEKFNTNFFTSIYNTVVPGGKVIVVGTVIGNLCFVTHLANNNYGYKVVRCNAVHNPIYKEVDNVARRIFVGGVPLWKDMWSLEALNKQKESIGEELFDQEFMNIPFIQTGGRVFSKEYAYRTSKDYYIPKDKKGWKVFGPPEDKLAIGIDNNKGGHKGDYATIVVWGGRLSIPKVLATFQAKVDDFQLAEELNWFFTKFDYYVEKEGYNSPHRGKMYLGTVLFENNLGQALANYMKAYSWFNQRVLAERNKDNKIEALTQKYGFRTSASSKNYIISEFRVSLSKDEIILTDDIVSECQVYYYNDNYEANALDPYHDDLLMGAMIGYHNFQHEIYILSYDKENTYNGEILDDFQRNELNFIKSLGSGEDMDSFLIDNL